MRPGSYLVRPTQSLGRKDGSKKKVKKCRPKCCTQRSSTLTLTLTLTLTKVLHAAVFKCFGFVFTMSVGSEFKSF